MEIEIAIVLLAIFIGALALGLWAFVTLFVIAILMMVLGGDFSLEKAGILAAKVSVRASRSWELSAIPLFLLMGEMLFRADLSKRLFEGLAPIFRHFPGGLLHVNVAGCTTFAAVSGSSAATTATIGRISVPELLGRGYDRRLVLGSLAGSGSFGLLIPPSIAMIVYGVIADVSIVRLFAAGLIPGLVLAMMYSSYIALRGRGTKLDSKPENLSALLGLIPILVLVFVVLGSIYGGIASPTEAASVGVAGACMLILIERRMSWELLRSSLVAATRLTCVMGAVVISASVMSAAAGMVGIPQALANWVVGMSLSATMLLIAIAVFYIFLGLFLDGISIMVVSLPLIMPIVIASGIDPIWFGVFLVLMIELGLMTPPVGFNLFIIQSISGATIGEIARATVPFFLIMLSAVVLFTIFPQIVLWLPEKIF
ncbi:TRAP transporter large permease subunit [Amphritea opalescens]|uniref:TRAP transporter large permease protein n=1 Tax=Amphritea opalescens TaxID=2490544 RepID=A0A430KLT3_9GAMM|nr:TRAP transporter large permease subunit [Amphritea opalescens]RTE64404.1 TRAP transporter large permease subunit [Amphritea opalescens]